MCQVSPGLHQYLSDYQNLGSNRTEPSTASMSGEKQDITILVSDTGLAIFT